ncbi:hypothetical protein TNCV_1269341 [Trichonephila clavipes]|nr:hypothetical protein TNCV_1269341 [Trichonephila clavipes]
MEAPDHPESVLPQNLDGTEQIRTATCMALKAKAIDRRENLAFSRDEFRPRKPSSTYIKLGTTTNRVDGRGKRRTGHRGCKFSSLSRLRSVMLDTCVQATRWIVKNDESVAVTSALTISRSSRSDVALGPPLPF